MKLIIGDYEVDVKAKRRILSDKYSMMDTIDFLNKISIYCSLAGDKRKEQGYSALASECDTMGDDIYQTLKKAGAYKEV